MLSKVCLSVLLFLALCSCGLSFRQKAWWETSIMYQVYPRSFKDSDNDGVGDLKGIIQKMDYFVELGVESIWVQPFYPDGGADLGYDMTDFVGVNPLFGTMDDFDELLNQAHKRDIKVILDFVPNHTSDQHDWFIKSCNGIKPYDEYFVWKDGKWNDTLKKMFPPNNWLSVFGGDGWTWNEKRGQYYFHQFSPLQPDLNFRSEKLQSAIEYVLRFWLDKGIDGWRIDALKHLFEVSDYKDEPHHIGRENGDSYYDLRHIYTTDLPETYEQLIKWRELVDSYEKKTGKPRMIVTECYSEIDLVMKYYQYNGKKAANYPFNFGFIIETNKDSRAPEISRVVLDWLDSMPPGSTANWVYGNHDTPRIVSKLGREMGEAYVMIGLVLPGVAVLYYGDEIGMSNGIIRPDQRMDPNNGGGVVRDGQRTPMQWDDSMNGGFSKAPKTWLPMNPNYWAINVEAQEKAEWSHLKIFKELSKLRKTPTFIHGETATHVMNDGWVLGISRSLDAHDKYILLVNINSRPETVSLSGKVSGLGDYMYVRVPSMNSKFKIGQRVVTDKFYDSKARITLRPKESVLFVQTVDGKPPKVGE